MNLTFYETALAHALAATRPTGPTFRQWRADCRAVADLLAERDNFSVLLFLDECGMTEQEMAG